VVLARGLECLDLAATMPKETSVLCDDVHLNEAGRALVVWELTAYLAKDLMKDRSQGE
jgi:hypothetical protein